jgi:uroporphyrinogen-III synthase
VVASPSAARVLAEINPAIPVVSIGPETTSAARAAGLRVLREADSADVEGLVRAVNG